MWILRQALEIYQFVVLAYILSTWVAPGSHHPIVQILKKAVEPVLAPLRRVIPPIGGFDLSSLILLLGLQFLGRFI